MVHQAEPLYLARLNTTGRSPGILEVPLKTDLPTAIHPLGTAHSHHRIGDCFSFRSAVFCATGSPLVGCGSSPRTDGLGRREASASTTPGE